jgi:hypothetical protein
VKIIVIHFDRTIYLRLYVPKRSSPQQHWCGWVEVPQAPGLQYAYPQLWQDPASMGKHASFSPHFCVKTQFTGSSQYRNTMLTMFDLFMSIKMTNWLTLVICAYNDCRSSVTVTCFFANTIYWIISMTGIQCWQCLILNCGIQCHLSCLRVKGQVHCEIMIDSYLEW